MLPLRSDQQQVFAGRGSLAWVRPGFQVSIWEAKRISVDVARTWRGSFQLGLLPRTPVIPLIEGKHRPLPRKEAWSRLWKVAMQHLQQSYMESFAAVILGSLGSKLSLEALASPFSLSYTCPTSI